MRRGQFLAASAAFALASPGIGAADELHAGSATTQDALFALGKPGGSGEWVRLIVESGAAYQKQIGLGIEGGDESLAYVETQIGMPGGSCNPNTLKKTYLRSNHFGTLIATPRVLACVAHSGTMLTRWADAGAGQEQAAADARLRLLDVPYLYDHRPLVIESIVHGVPLRLREPYVTTHVVGRFAKPREGHLERVELWLTPEVPFGVARYRALAEGFDPITVSVYSHGRAFKSELAMSLRTVRAMTPDGQTTSFSSAP